jgi:hypothetical protein
MAIVVEDGTGLATADSYLSVTDANSYFTNLNNTTWVGSDAEKEAALRKATSYLDATYVWIGYILKTTQSLNWPRTSATDSQGRDLDNSVPQKVKDACAELALASLTDDLVKIKENSDYVKKQKVGELEIEYSSGAPVDREYSYVDRLLSDLYSSKSGGTSTIKLDRV